MICGGTGKVASEIPQLVPGGISLRLLPSASAFGRVVLYNDTLGDIAAKWSSEIQQAINLLEFHGHFRVPAFRLVVLYWHTSDMRGTHSGSASY
ncbi:hypothetical protein FNV43_RR25387 [Rhamnella rubrinervis]|uniref:Uncharacterized protein n=1 Tax=Rhamnella rubrinervis TaxID=2594499 RepID=A0A8K0DUG6_9ROSA|nr:hypothetical protein FNV43_RR25387 [Rhamnella rubrinervis]